jgi:hypothetical protein
MDAMRKMLCARTVRAFRDIGTSGSGVDMPRR